MEPWKGYVFIQFSLCSGGNKAGDGSGSSRKSKEEEGCKLGGFFGVYRVQIGGLEFKLEVL